MDSFLNSLLPIAVVVIAMWAMTATYWQKFRPGAARYVALVAAGVGVVMMILTGSIGGGLGYFLPIFGYGLGGLVLQLAMKKWAGHTREVWGFAFWVVLVLIAAVPLFVRPSMGVVAILLFFVGNAGAAGLAIPLPEEEELKPPAAPAKPTVTEASVASAAGAPAAEEEQGRGQEEEPESPARNIRGLRPA